MMIPRLDFLRRLAGWGEEVMECEAHGYVQSHLHSVDEFWYIVVVRAEEDGFGY